MGDPHVQRWRQAGHVVMWVNRRDSAKEWNLAASDAACDAFIELLQLMEDGEWSSKKAISLTRPTRTPDHGGRFPIRTATELTIKYPKGRVSDEHWQFTEDDRKILLEIGRERLRELRDAIDDMKQGAGDYCIGPSDGRLWIWWWIETFIVPNEDAHKR